MTLMQQKVHGLTLGFTGGVGNRLYCRFSLINSKNADYWEIIRPNFNVFKPCTSCCTKVTSHILLILFKSNHSGHNLSAS